jgi:hypothetical protein
VTALYVRALDVPFVVHGMPAEDGRRFARLWQHCQAPADVVDPVPVEVRRSNAGWLATVGGADVFAADGNDGAVLAASTAINVSATTRTPLLALHAAVVVHDGQTLLVPGGSGAGKTTLTLALLAAGWTYVTDEALALDWRTGDLRPYARPMGVSDWTLATLGLTGIGVVSGGETLVGADQVGEITTGAGPVSMVLLLARDDGLRLPELSPAEPMDALQELFQRGFTIHRDPGPALTMLADLVREAEVRHLSYGDPVAAAAAVTGAVGIPA